jgi:hypothetical protein
MEETVHIVYHMQVDGDKLLVFNPLSAKDEKSGAQRQETDEYRE